MEIEVNFSPVTDRYSRSTASTPMSSSTPVTSSFSTSSNSSRPPLRARTAGNPEDFSARHGNGGFNSNANKYDHWNSTPPPKKKQPPVWSRMGLNSKMEMTALETFGLEGGKRLKSHCKVISNSVEKLEHIMMSMYDQTQRTTDEEQEKEITLINLANPNAEDASNLEADEGADIEVVAIGAKSSVADCAWALERNLNQLDGLLLSLEDADARTNMAVDTSSMLVQALRQKVPGDREWLERTEWGDEEEEEAAAEAVKTAIRRRTEEIGINTDEANLETVAKNNVLATADIWHDTVLEGLSIPSEWNEFCKGMVLTDAFLELKRPTEEQPLLNQLLTYLYYSKWKDDQLKMLQGRPISSLASFICNFFLELWGIFEIAQRSVWSLAVDAFNYRHSSPMVAMFCKHCALDDPLPSEHLSFQLQVFARCWARLGKEGSGELSSMEHDGKYMLKLSDAFAITRESFAGILSDTGIDELIDKLNDAGTCLDESGSLDQTIVSRDDLMNIIMKRYGSLYINIYEQQHVKLQKLERAEGGITYNKRTGPLSYPDFQASIDCFADVPRTTCAQMFRQVLKSYTNPSDSHIRCADVLEIAQQWGLIRTNFAKVTCESDQGKLAIKAFPCREILTFILEFDRMVLSCMVDDVRAIDLQVAVEFDSNLETIKENFAENPQDAEQYLQAYHQHRFNVIKWLHLNKAKANANATQQQQGK